MILRRLWLLAILLPLSLCATSCEDDDSILVPPTVIEGRWEVEVTETADTCDVVTAPALDLVARVWEDAGSWFVELNDPAGGECWVWPIVRAGETASLDYGYEASSPCNAGCRYRMTGSLALTFQPGGLFDGIETATFEPRTAACAVAECGFPCTTSEDHFWAVPYDRACPFACETTYAWTGVHASALPGPSPCAP